MTEGAMEKPKRAGAVPVAGQVLGVAAALAGVYLLAGLAVALIVGGVLLAAWATLREAGWV
ncbi:MAG TPA: hypothetical protein VIQ30_01250 [Pseudonocardia sp.]